MKADVRTTSALFDARMLVERGYWVVGDEIGVRDLIQGEWDALHANGIVPQKPPKFIVTPEGK